MIEIRGVNFANKGAELMLHAILKKVSSRFPGTKFAMEPGPDRPFGKRASLGLYQKMRYVKRGRDFTGLLERLLPESFMSNFGIIESKNIEILLDASGFSYGDQWASSSFRAQVIKAHRLKRLGARVVYLPQALGPFSGTENKRLLAQLVEDADLVFPRDRMSYEFVMEVVGENKKITMAPDFTNLIDGTPPAKWKSDGNRICVIPNEKMVTMTNKGAGAEYLELMRRVMDITDRQGLEIFILVHGGKSDRALAENLAKLSANNVEIVSEDDPLRIKGIIGTCRGVVSSRYHGLISSLSQGIPALATSWSHKYEMLFDEYAFSDGCLSASLGDEELKRRIDIAFGQSGYQRMRDHLIAIAEEQKSAAEGMWDKVFTVMQR